MKVKEQFALALRIIGLVGIIFIVRAVVRDPLPVVGHMVTRIVCLLFGLYLLRGGSLVVKFAYPESAAEPPEKPSA